MTAIHLTRVSPSTTIQDRGRPGALQYGISASGPMDRGAFERALARLGRPSGEAIEITRAGIAFEVEEGPAETAFEGGAFSLEVNCALHPWPALLRLGSGDKVAVTPGPHGNYGYVAFDGVIDVPRVLGSRATNLVAGIGRSVLQAGDRLSLRPVVSQAAPVDLPPPASGDGPIRFLWGLHADLFASEIRQAFVARHFVISTRLDRMGVRLGDPAGVFSVAPSLSLVSDAIVPGDVQILGDGTPIVLMRDHQPTGGYPRIATVISADLDRFAQLRPGTELAFAPVSLHKARQLYLSSRVR
jgi:biotin-dependent carboxylase-like uncharacterized protein